MERQKQIQSADNQKKKSWGRLSRFATGGLITFSGILGAYETTHAQTQDPCVNAISGLLETTKGAIRPWVDTTEGDTYSPSYFRDGITGDPGADLVAQACTDVANANGGFIPDATIKAGLEGDWIAPPTVVPQEVPVAPIAPTVEAPVGPQVAPQTTIGSGSDCEVAILNMGNQDLRRILGTFAQQPEVILTEAYMSSQFSLPECDNRDGVDQIIDRDMVIRAVGLPYVAPTDAASSPQVTLETQIEPSDDGNVGGSVNTYADETFVPSTNTPPISPATAGFAGVGLSLLVAVFLWLKGDSSNSGYENERQRRYVDNLPSGVDRDTHAYGMNDGGGYQRVAMPQSSSSESSSGIGGRSSSSSRGQGRETNVDVRQHGNGQGYINISGNPIPERPVRSPEPNPSRPSPRHADTPRQDLDEIPVVIGEVVRHHGRGIDFGQMMENITRRQQWEPEVHIEPPVDNTAQLRRDAATMTDDELWTRYRITRQD